MSRKQKNRKTTRKSLVDIALLTAGVIEPSVFAKCVSAIKREMESFDCEFYVMRNGNVPETNQAYGDIINTIENPKVKQSHEDLGFPQGANRVIRAGTSPLVLFISDDVVLHEGTLEKLVKRMDDPTIGLCGLKLIFPPDSQDRSRPAGRVQHIGHGVDIQGNITHPLLGWMPDNPKCNVSREVQSVTGATFIVRRSVFLRAGGFFEGYGKGYFEDVDLNLTIRKMGHRIFVDTDAVATHYTGATFIKKQQPVPMDVNRIVFLQRHAQDLVCDSWLYW